MTRLKKLMAESEQKHLAKVKGLKEELAEKNEQQDASAEKTKRLLDEAESSVESANLNFDALQAKEKTWHSKIAAINFFLSSEFLLFLHYTGHSGLLPSTFVILLTFSFCLQRIFLGPICLPSEP